MKKEIIIGRVQLKILLCGEEFKGKGMEFWMGTLIMVHIKIKEQMKILMFLF